MSNIEKIDPESKTVSANRSLRESGSSVVITIPPELVSSLNWEAGDELYLTADWGKETVTVEKED